MRKIKLVKRSEDDVFIFEEFTDGVSVLLGRSDSKNVSKKIGEILGFEVEWDDCFGDYIYKVLKGKG